MELVSCAHCGSPVSAASGARGPFYCCAGCAMLAGVLGESGSFEAGSRESRSLILRLGLAAFFAAITMMLSLFFYSLELSGDEPPARAVVTALRALLVCSSLPVFALLAPPFLKGTMRDFRRRRFTMDSLVAAGASAALVYSIVQAARGSGLLYFDTATMVLLLVTAGRLLEAAASVQRRRAVQDLSRIQPPFASAWRDERWQPVRVEALEPGDRVRVCAGERIPVDGSVLGGTASVDTCILTGEPLPSVYAPGDTVHAGTICLDGVLELEPRGSASLIARIARSVEEAQAQRSPLERAADRASGWFVPLIVAVAAGAGAWWWPEGPERALMTSLSVLVVACPCALGVAMPVVNSVVLAAAARRGVVVRSAEALERLAGIDTIAFDKTGTLTCGQVEVREVLPSEGAEPALVLRTAAAAACGSVHPISQAIAALQPSMVPERVEVFAGRGVSATAKDGSTILLGSPEWVGPRSEGRVAALAAEERSVVWCAMDGRLLGAVVVHDPVLPEAARVIAECRELGVETVLLSGDRPAVVQRVARELGIPHAEGALLPEEKAARVRAQQSLGKRVAMVGDGLNDAPALAAADVGIAISNGVDVARETAEVFFVGSGLRKLPQLLHLARRGRRIAHQNLAWAFGYNLIAVGMAAAGCLRPVWAAALMFASSVVVLGNSVRAGRRPAS